MVMHGRNSGKFTVKVGHGMLGRGDWAESRVTKGSGIGGSRVREERIEVGLQFLESGRIMFEIRNRRFDGVKRSNGGHEGDLGWERRNKRRRRKDAMSADVVLGVDVGIDVWVSSGEVVKWSTIYSAWSKGSKGEPDKRIMKGDRVGAATVKFPVNDVRVADARTGGVTGNFTKETTVLIFLVGIPNAPNCNPTLDWIRVVKVISHQQINRIPRSKVDLVGWVGHMGVGASKPKETGAEVGLEERKKILDGACKFFPDDGIKR